MMRALDRKLWRDIWRMRLHAAGVVLVLGCGLALFIMAVGMRESLERTREDYYASNAMADLAVSIVRAIRAYNGGRVGGPVYRTDSPFF